MDKALSERLKWVSLIATFLVVLRHSLNLTAFFGADRDAPLWLYSVEWGISRMTECAVPAFFLISGCLFFRHPVTNLSGWRRMLHKKAYTLLVPFLLWNLIGAGILMAAGMFQPSDTVEGYLLRLALSDYNGVLWYVECLMLMMLVSPLYAWIFKVDSLWLYLPVLFGMLYVWWPIDMRPWSTEGALFFVLGGVLQHRNLLGRSVSAPWLLVALLLWMGICCVDSVHLSALHKARTLLGVFVLWMVCGRCLRLKSEWRELLLSCPVFFVYVLHQYLIKTMKVSLSHVFPGDALIALVAYFLLPIVTIVLLWWLGSVLKRAFPRLYSTCMGGRM